MKPTKSDLLVSIASIPDTDPRLEKLAALLRGDEIAKTPETLRLLNFGQVAEKTGLSRTTIWRLCRDGQIKTVEVRRGSRRVPESEIRRFVRVESEG